MYKMEGKTYIFCILKNELKYVNPNGQIIVGK